MPSVAVRATHALTGVRSLDGRRLRRTRGRHLRCLRRAARLPRGARGRADGCTGRLSRCVPAATLAIPTGGMLPAGADAVVMIEYTAETMPGTIEIHRAVAPGEGSRAGRRGRETRRRARSARTAAPAARPRTARRRRGDHRRGLCAPEGRDLLDRRRSCALRTRRAGPGQVRDACTLPIAALVQRSRWRTGPLGIVPDDPEALREALVHAMAEVDMIVITAGSSVGTRDETASVVGVARRAWDLLPRPRVAARQTDSARRVWRRSRSSGSPATLARRSWCSVSSGHRSSGSSVVGRHAVPEPVVRARLSRDLPSVTGRLDVVQVRVHDGLAEPIFGKSALLVGSRRGGRLPNGAGARDRARRGSGGRGDPLPLMASTPFIRDVPAAEALAGLVFRVRSAHRARTASSRCASRSRRGRSRHGRADLGSSLVSTFRRRGHGRHRVVGLRHDRRQRDDAGRDAGGRVRGGRHGRSPPRPLRRRGHARTRPLRRRRGRAAGGRRALPARPVDRRGHQRYRAPAARGSSPARRRRRRLRRGRTSPSWPSVASP